MAKGYDTVNLAILDDCVNKIEDETVKNLLHTWVLMVFNLDVVVNNTKIKRTRGIPMGLSLSPIVFVYYVHVALGNIEKSSMAMYIDDIALVLKKNRCKDNVDLVNNIIKSLKSFDLVINEKKTMFDTPDNELVKEFNGRFTKFSIAKYLGRVISVNGDGKVTPDDRFFNLKGERTDAMIYWATFFVKRLVYNAALDAKMRYKLIMWRTKSKTVRKELWIKHWKFFRKCMFSYSYVQVSFSIFNIFRYFVDVTDIIKIKKRLINNESIDNLKNDLLKDLIVDIPQIDNSLKNVKFNFEILKIMDDDIEATKRFLDNVWKSFKLELVNDYKIKKEETSEDYYEKVYEFCNSKLFKGFGILQLIVFLHFNRNNKKTRHKDAFVLFALRGLYADINKTVNKVFYGVNKIDEVEKFNIDFILDNILM